MSTATYFKTGLVVLVVAIGVREWSHYKESLRLEGEVRVLTDQLQPAVDSLEALRESQRLADSIRAVEVARAAQEAREAREDAQEAQQEAQAARRDRDRVRSSVIEEYGDTVRVAVERVEAAADRELEQVQQVADLRAAEAVAWETAFNEEQARRIAAEDFAAREAEVSQARARIIATLQAQVDRKGHGVLVDVALAAGSIVLGYVGGRANK